MRSLKVLVAAAALLSLAGESRASGTKDEPYRPEVEVVFALDTTGSMGGLIEGAKAKIWAIANEIAKGQPAPKVKMGLVAYRDKGDAFVTRAFDLSDNIDGVYEHLASLQAQGGGDGPEHVLKGLEQAIESMSWSRNPNAFKVVYLVGDAPAHVEYQDTPPLKSLIKRAVKAGLIVNAIQCGADPRTAQQWQEIARLGNGRYLAIAQDGGVAAIATPFDERLAELSRRMDSTMIAYGEKKAEGARRAKLADKVAAMAPASVAAERGLFKAKEGFDAEFDLAAAVEENKVDANKLTAEERARVKKALEERSALRKELNELSSKRAGFLKEASKSSPKDSFDAKVAQSIREQAALKGIRYAAPTASPRAR